MSSMANGAGSTATPTPLTSLPSELLFQILFYLPAVDLAAVSRTSQALREYANSDHLWAQLVNSNLPTHLREPSPFPTFKSLYVSHHPLWFVVRNKIWFSDNDSTGKLILARYDHRRGVIEAYRLVAKLANRRFQHWEHNASVMVQQYEPILDLWLDDPVIHIEKFVPSPLQNKLDWRMAEIRMPMALETQRVFTTFILCSKMSPQAKADPSRAVWPPRIIPAEERADTTNSELRYPAVDDKPLRLDEINESTFRIRKWIQFGSISAAVDVGTVSNGVSTYSTLQPDLYTPTPEKPYQGIWVGDYSGHGSEFLLIIQRESPARSPRVGYGTQSHIDDREDGAPSDADMAEDTDLPSGGSLEAIKLTGDPNVPRGEVTFAADDIGPRGMIRVAEEEIFKNVRVVRSRGHIAGTNFIDEDIFIPSQLFLVSHDCLAHYWEQLGQVAYYYRVDIDKILGYK